MIINSLIICSDWPVLKRVKPPSPTKLSFKRGSVGLFDRARPGPEHGASFENVNMPNKYGGSIRSHDSYKKSRVKNIYTHYRLWEF